MGRILSDYDRRDGPEQPVGYPVRRILPQNRYATQLVPGCARGTRERASGAERGGVIVGRGAVMTGWAPKGHTPILHRRTRSHEKVWTLGALTISPGRRHLGLYPHWHPHKNITAIEVIAFLHDLLRHLRGHVIRIW